MYRKYVKRLLDFVLALIMLIISTPLMTLLAVLVRLKLGKPIIFAQLRPGRDEKPFTLYKFRTMTDKKDETGKLLPDQERITRFGKLLRSTSLDELPELINILKGDMSFIGPRPLLLRYLPYFRREERVRSLVRPGITGLAQINGRNALSWDQRFAYDIRYVQDLSFLLDLKILLKTISVVLKRKDILVGDEHVLKDLDIERGEEFHDESKI